MDAVESMMQKAVDGNVFPGAVLLVSVDSEIVFHRAFGNADIYSGDKMTKDTIFDLASLTKPLATTMAVMKLVEKKMLGYYQTIETFLESVVSDLSGAGISEYLSVYFDGRFKYKDYINDKKNITIEDLLRHASGLPAFKPYYEFVMQCPRSLRSQCLRALAVCEPLVYRPGQRELYSDIGYILLAWIVEVLADQRIDSFLEQYVYSPAGIDDLFFPGSSYSGKGHFASTEKCPWRGKIIRAEVHDDNAWAAGGIEGHAGLFGTALGVFVLLDQLMKALHGEKNKLVSSGLLRQFLTKKGCNNRVAGFDTPSRPVSASGKYFSNFSIGHLGFTGTSFWIDPEKSFIVILLTNRVHPSRENEKIKRFRPLIHNLVYEKFLL